MLRAFAVVGNCHFPLSHTLYLYSCSHFTNNDVVQGANTKPCIYITKKKKKEPLRPTCLKQSWPLHEQNLGNLPWPTRPRIRITTKALLEEAIVLIKVCDVGRGTSVSTYIILEQTMALNFIPWRCISYLMFSFNNWINYSNFVEMGRFCNLQSVKASRPVLRAESAHWKPFNLRFCSIFYIYEYICHNVLN